MQRWQSLQCPQKYCPFVIFSYDIYFLILKLFLKTFFKIIEDKIPIKVPYREILTVTALCCRTSKMTFKLHYQDNNVPNPFHSQKDVPFLMVFFLMVVYNLPNWKEPAWLTAMVKKNNNNHISHNDRIIIWTAISTRTSLQITSLPYKSPVMLTMMLLLNIKYPLHASKRVIANQSCSQVKTMQS